MKQDAPEITTNVLNVEKLLLRQREKNMKKKLMFKFNASSAKIILKRDYQRNMNKTVI